MAAIVKRRIDVSAATFFRLAGVGALVWIWIRLWQWVLIVVVAAILAVSLDPLVGWLDRRGLRRRFAAPLIVVLLATVVVCFLYFSAAALKEQAGMLGDRVSDLRQQVADSTPDALEQLLSAGASGSGAEPAGAARPEGTEGGSRQGGAGGLVMRFARAVISALLSLAVALVLTVYFLLDGRRTYEWFVAFAPPGRRPRVRETAEEACKAIIGYMRGNVATSVLAAIATFIVLSLLKVPAALLLAIVAGILNFIPVIGIVLSLLPAVLLALTVSPAVAIAVAAFYLAYNAVENYYIQPRVYGHEMQLSGLAVIGAFAVGAELGGVLGALIALPLAAMYPPVETLWLKGKLDPAAVEDHRRIEQTDEH
jgi:predicted PurR-regulated permease PerM